MTTNEQYGHPVTRCMTDKNAWRPNTTLETLRRRAALCEKIRQFMREREILEVDTPVLSHYGITDPNIDSLSLKSALSDSALYLHTSPEFCMKRLLAQGAGPIYQIAHVFRDEERGRRHLPEFSMLEWYRPGFDYYQLMDETGDLLQALRLARPARLSYAMAFTEALGFDPHAATLAEIREISRESGWHSASRDRRELLDFIFSSRVMPALQYPGPLIIYDYPACMAALATLKAADPPVSERFELFINGLEIANGFNELRDAALQRRRFQKDIARRRRLQKQSPPIDPRFLAALKSGLPQCAGIALGLERLMMAIGRHDDINEVCAFTLKNN